MTVSKWFIFKNSGTQWWTVRNKYLVYLFASGEKAISTFANGHR